VDIPAKGVQILHDPDQHTAVVIQLFETADDMSAADALDGMDAGDELLALDSVDAGVGDTVVVVREGWSASTASTGRPGAAIDSAIVGVVDKIDYNA